MQYLGGKSGPGARIADICSKKLGPNALFVDMFCGSLNVVRHVQTPRRLAVDACGPLILMWRNALRGWVPPTEVLKEEYDRIKATRDPHDPLTAFVLFGCSFGGKWAGGYAKNRPTQRYAEHASHQVVAKASDCHGLVLEHATFQSKHPGCWTPGTVLYADPPYAGTTGYKALEPFNSEAFWFWAGEHARRGVHVFVSEYKAPDGWKLVDEQVATQAGRLTPGAKEKRVDRLFYRGPAKK
jgi:DNA adenine methylase